MSTIDTGWVPAEALERAKPVAATVLDAGYQLYPYRPAAIGDGLRWPLRSLPPGADGELGTLRIECVTPQPGIGLVHLRLRFLQYQFRQVEQGGPGGAFLPVERLAVGGTRHGCGDEAVPREVIRSLPLAELLNGYTVPVEISGGTDTEPITAATGETYGRIVRTRWRLSARMLAEAEQTRDGVRLRLSLRNTATSRQPDGPGAQREALIACHLMLVLPESTQRALGSGQLPGEVLEWWTPEADAVKRPESDTVLVGGVPVGKGERVVLHPGRLGRTDAQDMFLEGKSATVQLVFTNVDGGYQLAVTLDDDPVAELLRTDGRYWYFAPEEVEPLRGDG